MITYDKLTETEKNIHSKKNELSFNYELFQQIYKFVFTRISDPEVITIVNTLLVTHLDSVDNFISDYLHKYETDCKKDSAISAD